jgi:cytochrome c
MLSTLSRRSRWSAMALAVLCASGVITAGWSWRSQRQAESVARAMTGGDPSPAPELMRRYGCVGCHTIPGVPGGDGQVGSPLAGLRSRVYIAGVATNSAENLVHWIVVPQAFSPRTAMPATGISEAEARDVAAYLYAQ